MSFALLIFKTYAPPLFHHLLQHFSPKLSKPFSARFLFPNLKLPETACDQQKVPLFFIYGMFEYFLPIASSNNCTVHTLWAIFPFPALYQGFFWFFCVFTSSSSSLSLLHSLQTIAFSFPLPSSCFSLIPHFFFLSPL